MRDGWEVFKIQVETWINHKKDLGRAFQKHKRTKKNQHKVHKNQQGVGWVL